MRTPVRRRSISDFSVTPLAAALAVALAPQAAHAVNIRVNVQGDSSQYDTVNNVIGLRGAINFLNTTDVNGNLINCTGSDTIQFVANGPFISGVSSDLPSINCPGLVIDGAVLDPVTLSPNGDNVLHEPGYAGSNFFGFFGGFSGAPITIKNIEVAGWTYGTGINGNVNVLNSKVHDNNTGIDGRNNSQIIGNQVYSNSTGIYVGNYGGVTVANNTVYNNSSYGIDVESDTGTISVAGNTVYSNSTGIFACSYGGLTISGNTVYGNDNNGIDVEDSSNVIVSSNLVGLDASGPLPGNYEGIYVYNSTAIAIAANTIGSSADCGILVELDTNSSIAGNKVGTDVSGSTAIANDYGIVVVNGSTGTNIADNIVSGNLDNGIDVEQSSSVLVNSNTVGANSTATSPLSNGGVAIYGACMTDYLVMNNIIGGNSEGTGIEFDGVTGGGVNDIFNNKINVQGDGVTALGNSAYGIVLYADSCVARAPAGKAGKKAMKAIVRPKSSFPAGDTTNVRIANNVIQNNSADGILLSGADGTYITGNNIAYNSNYGVDIFSGVSNTILDNTQIYNNGANTGKNVNLNTGNNANDSQVFPTVGPTGVTEDPSTGNILVQYTFNGVAGPTYEIQVCQNMPQPLGPGCSKILMSTTIAPATMPFTGTITVPAGTGTTPFNISLNATNTTTGDTSEFSPPVGVTLVPGALITPTTLNFGPVGVNSNSSPLNVTVSSNGTAPLSLASITSPSCYGGTICYGGPFSCTTNCSTLSPYSPGQSCTITATFHPTTLGTFSTTIGICDNATASIPGTSITLVGTGVTPAAADIIPNLFNFGQVGVGTQSPAEQFFVFNPGPLNANIGTPSVSPEFLITSTDCGSSLNANGGCHVNVVFAPNVPGPVSGTLSVPVSNSALPLTITKRGPGTKVAAGPPPTAPSNAIATLSGVGTVAALNLPSVIDFGDYTQGTPPIVRTIQLTNNAQSTLFFQGIAVSGPFTMKNGCGAPLAFNTSCTIELDYSDAVLGTHTGTLSIQGNLPGSTGVISLIGLTGAIPAPRITVSPTIMGFGDRLLGSASGTQRVTIANVGSAPATLGLGVSPDFLISGTTCGPSLDAATSCYADIAFRPVAFGPRNGTFTVVSNADGSPFVVTLGGTGCRPYNLSIGRLGSSFNCAP